MQDLYHTLLVGDYGGMPDSYFVAQGLWQLLHGQPPHDGGLPEPRQMGLRMAVINTAKSGFFSSDRTIRQYNDTIWHIQDSDPTP